MLVDFINQITTFLQKSYFYLKPWSIALGIIWCVNILNWITGSWLNILGINPRHPFGLVGIIFSPFLHRNFSHLLFNTIPLFVLGLTLLVSNGSIHFYFITAFIAILGGLGVWLFARKGLHIGASGVISGYFGYILMNAYTQPSFTSILTAILAIYYFGGIIIGLFPQEKATSWESHLFGFVSGMLCAYIPVSMLHALHIV